MLHYQIERGRSNIRNLEFNIENDYVQMLILETMGLEAEDAPDWF